jgi:hypothetical protein
MSELKKNYKGLPIIIQHTLKGQLKKTIGKTIGPRILSHADSID